jgi:hypothetical protein
MRHPQPHEATRMKVTGAERIETAGKRINMSTWISVYWCPVCEKQKRMPANPMSGREFWCWGTTVRIKKGD